MEAAFLAFLLADAVQLTDADLIPWAESQLMDHEQICYIAQQPGRKQVRFLEDQLWMLANAPMAEEVLRLPDAKDYRGKAWDLLREARLLYDAGAKPGVRLLLKEIRKTIGEDHWKKGTIP